MKQNDINITEVIKEPIQKDPKLAQDQMEFRVTG